MAIEFSSRLKVPLVYYNDITKKTYCTRSKPIHFFSPQMKCNFPPNIGPISAVSGPSPLSDYKTTTSLNINWLGNVSYNMCLSLPI